MSILNEAEDLSNFKPRNLITIYGRSGSGKTATLRTFNGKKLLIDASDKGASTLKGEKGIKMVKIPHITEGDPAQWVLTVLNELYDNPKHGYGTIALDTITHLKNLCVSHWELKNGRKIKWKDYGDITNELKNIVLLINDLCDSQPEITFVVYAQEVVKDIEDDENPDDEIRSEGNPDLFDSVLNVLLPSSEHVLHLFRRRVEKEVKGEFKSVFQYAYHTNSEKYYTKVRKPVGINVPKVMINFDYRKFQTKLSGGKK